MVIAKFTLAFFLVYLAWLQALRLHPRAPVGGPYYYADPPGAANPVDPRWRLSPARAFRSRRLCKVWFDRFSRVARVEHWEGREERWRVDYVWTKDGTLRYRRWSVEGRTVRADVPGPGMTWVEW